MRYTTRPLSDRAWLRPAAQRTPSQFKVTWSTALDLLERELDMIDGAELVIEIDVREQDLRLDGMLRANARAAEPAVIVAFESKHGPLLYRSDQYSGAPYWCKGMQEAWQHNVYAVARTLESLRAVDRYGAVRSGEQYRGFRQIGGAPAMVTEPPLTDEQAWRVIARAVQPTAREVWWEDAAQSWQDGRTAPDGTSGPAMVRLARRNTHPDTRRDDVDVTFDDVQRAAAHLRSTGPIAAPRERA
ncbi:hypothetical protein CWIS_13710 [Cellulomonas sp. A375-1]|uniref:hypothetical protein n=1 Tax=Cellulomonas sp. A375-1 TaxID=1672219 RepID=UPI000652649F|nr:hypothetical protein [Cellulomonas sp. A375-1]KMM44875.1 hypothetical protein CWIS_13710 [Cellulomonas sp. A375-1]